MTLSEFHFSEDIAFEVADTFVKNDTLVWPSGSYTEVTFSILIQRQGSSVTVTVIAPGMAITVMGILYLFLPRGVG